MAGLYDRVAVLAKNCVEHVLFYYGASKAGVVPVPLNYRLAPAEWLYILRDAGARLVLARGEFVPAVHSLQGELPDVARWVALEGHRPQPQRPGRSSGSTSVPSRPTDRRDFGACSFRESASSR